MLVHSMPITSIQLDAKTRKKLAGLKAHRRESYDDVIGKLMRLIPESDDEGRYTAEFRAGLLQARIESLEGRTYSMGEVTRLLGLKG